jgi:hypothetical protein
MSFAKTLSRDEMKNVKAGSGGYVVCDGCQNSTCQGYVDNCSTGVYEMCGAGPAGGSGPKAICVQIR